MDYLIFSELTVLGCYLLWLGQRFIALEKKISGVRPTDTQVANQPASTPAKEVQIIRFKDNSYTILARVSEDHESVGLALGTPDLGILHPDGKIQRTSKDCN